MMDKNEKKTVNASEAILDEGQLEQVSGGADECNTCNNVYATSKIIKDSQDGNGEDFVFAGFPDYFG